MSASNATGRSKHASHVRIYHSLFDCAAYRALSLESRALLSELIRLYNGRNNGKIFLSVRDAEVLIGVANDATVTRAFRELKEHGLIVLVRPGSFQWKAGHASTWRLTFLATDDVPPSRDYVRWIAQPGSKAARRLERLGKSNLRASFARLSAHVDGTNDANGSIETTQPVRKVGAAKMQNPQDFDQFSNPEFGAHLGSHLLHQHRAHIEECTRVRNQALEWLSDPSPTRTQRQLSRLTGVGESKLSRFLHCSSGRKTLTVDALERVVSAIKVDVPLRVVR